MIDFPENTKEKMAWTGNPIRKEIMTPLTTGASEYLNLETNVPVILILGGSQGAQKINEAVIDIIPRLLENYQVIFF